LQSTIISLSYPMKMNLVGYTAMQTATTRRRLPLTLQSLYADLLARLQSEVVLDLDGTPVQREADGRKYWYIVQQRGGRKTEKYLGPVSEELNRRVMEVRQANLDRRAREVERSRFVRMCVDGGLARADAQTGKILNALARSGLFRLRGVLVGTHAFRQYPGILGVTLPEALGITDDIDLAQFHPISIALDDQLDPTLAETLEQVGHFIARPSLHQHATAWQDTNNHIQVELLTPNEGPDRDEPLELPSLGAFATPLRFLDYLIHQPIPAAVLYRAGILVNIPRPERYAIHKLIVAVRRRATSLAKARKDIEQAGALIEVLSEDRPDELEQAFLDAWERGREWRTALASGARRLSKIPRAALSTLSGGHVV
jgi:hypothetical protein